LVVFLSINTLKFMPIAFPESTLATMHPYVRALIEHFQFDQIPVEGTLYKSTYHSETVGEHGGPAGTAIIGLYCDVPLSVSCFHRLTYDEVWHFYSGDPLSLYLLHPDGSSEEIIMGADPLQGHKVQYTVPAGVWQGGGLAPGGRYALFGCTMAPGFVGACFEGAVAEELIQKFPDQAEIIQKLSVNGHQTLMPLGFKQ
jgi:predicted cupin superfamily sugar epimerase